MNPPSDTELVAVDLTGPEAATVIRRCWADGEAVFVLDPTLPDAGKTAALWQVKPTAIIDVRGRRSMAGVPAPMGTAAVILTSGTTAVPKATTLTVAGMTAMALGYSTAIGAGAGDRWLAALPLSGVGGLAILARSAITGVPAVVHDRYRVESVAKVVAAGGVSIVSLVPTALTRLLDVEAPLDRLRVALIGGAPLSDRLRMRAAAAGVPVVTTYGMTETWGGFALDGSPYAGATARITAHGEIEVDGPMVMAGYRRDPARTADAMTPDGWLRTGDTGIWDEGRLVVTGRLRDRIITGGVTVSPPAVERILLTHDGIVDAAVAGVPDVEWGERVVAYIVPANPADIPTLDAVRNLVKEALPPACAPKEVRPVKRIPRNAAGKIQRRELTGRG